MSTVKRILSKEQQIMSEYARIEKSMESLKELMLEVKEMNKTYAMEAARPNPVSEKIETIKKSFMELLQKVRNEIEEMSARVNRFTENIKEAFKELTIPIKYENRDNIMALISNNNEIQHLSDDISMSTSDAYVNLADYDYPNVSTLVNGSCNTFDELMKMIDGYGKEQLNENELENTEEIEMEA